MEKLTASLGQRSSAIFSHGVWAIALVGVAIVALALIVGLPRFIAVYELYWSQSNIQKLFYEDLGLSHSWSSFIAVVGSFFMPSLGSHCQFGRTASYSGSSMQVSSHSHSFAGSSFTDTYLWRTRCSELTHASTREPVNPLNGMCKMQPVGSCSLTVVGSTQRLARRSNLSRHKFARRSSGKKRTTYLEE